MIVVQTNNRTKTPAKMTEISMMPAVTCKCKDKVGGNAKNCLCVAYENLRASQEEFFKIRDASEGRARVEGGGEESPVIQNYKIRDGYEWKVENGDDLGEMEPLSESGSACVKRRDWLLEEARNSGPVYGSGLLRPLTDSFQYRVQRTPIRRMRMNQKRIRSKLNGHFLDYGNPRFLERRLHIWLRPLRDSFQHWVQRTPIRRMRIKRE